MPRNKSEPKPRVLPDGAIESVIRKSEVGPRASKVLRTVSRATIAHRKALAEVMLTQGYTTEAIVAVFRERHSLARSNSMAVVTAVRRQWAADYEEDRPIWKMAAIKRLAQDLRSLRAMPDEKREWGVILAYEKLLSDIQGTKEPIQVDIVDSTQPILQIIASLTEEEQDRMVEEYKEMKQLAERAKELLPPVIEVKADAE